MAGRAVRGWTDLKTDSQPDDDIGGVEITFRTGAAYIIFLRLPDAGSSPSCHVWHGASGHDATQPSGREVVQHRHGFGGIQRDKSRWIGASYGSGSKAGRGGSFLEPEERLTIAPRNRANKQVWLIPQQCHEVTKVRVYQKQNPS